MCLWAPLKIITLRIHRPRRTLQMIRLAAVTRFDTASLVLCRALLRQLIPAACPPGDDRSDQHPLVPDP